MDIAHDFACDLLAPHFPEGMIDKNAWQTQLVMYYSIFAVGGSTMYIIPATLSFLHTFVWKKEQLYPYSTIDEKDLWKQIKLEISVALNSVWRMGFLMTPASFFIHRGFSQIYTEWPNDAAGYAYMFLSIVGMLAFTDCVIYWIHRGLHHPIFYRKIHKLHHIFRYTTPFTSHAMTPLDACTQGFPYYIFVYMVPFNNIVFAAMFMIVNMWSINIHDQVCFGSNYFLSAGHHTVHHADFVYDYGQYTTLWDRIGGTYLPAKATHDWDTGARTQAVDKNKRS